MPCTAPTARRRPAPRSRISSLRWPGKAASSRLDAAMINLLDLDTAGLTALFAEMDEPPFRARQVSHWLHQRLTDDIGAMTDLAKPLRERLAAAALVRGPTVIRDTSAADGTRKWLLDVGGGNAVDTVYIPEGNRERWSRGPEGE